MGSGNYALCGRRGWRRQVGQTLVEVVESLVAGAIPAEPRSQPLELGVWV